MRVLLFMAILCLAEASLANRFYPLNISDAEINKEPSVKDLYHDLNINLTDSRWDFETLGRPDKNVQLEKVVVEMMLDFKKAVLGQTPTYHPGSEQLFNRFNPNNPNYKGILGIDGTLDFVTGALLLMPPGPSFFETKTGKKLRIIFSKLRSQTSDLANVQNLNDQEKELLAAYTGGILWRLRGGGILKKKGTQSNRLFYVANGFRAIGKIIGKDTREIGKAYQGQLMRYGWGEWFDIGNNPNQRSETYDLVKMTERGLIQVQTAIIHVQRQKGRVDSLKASGLQMGPCYFWSWQEFVNIQEQPEMKPPLSPFLAGYPTTWGEVCTGAALGLGLIRSLN